MVEMKLPKYIGPHFRHNYTASKNVRERGGERYFFLLASLYCSKITQNFKSYAPQAF